MADEISSAPRPEATITPDRGAAFLALKSGTKLRQYVIDEVIGAGGFGITYRAHHAELTAKLFAVKEYFPRQFAARSGTQVFSTSDEDGLFKWGLDRFLQEAQVLSKCEHPGIVPVIDYFRENGTAYAVLGYVEGRQMGQWLQSLGRPPTQAELDAVMLPLLSALETVHAQNMLHRDIAPDNILVRPDGSPCLIDFGACREDIRQQSRKVSAIVKHGYSPLEQYHGVAELQGPWTDIYAVGATFYRAISGQPPMDSNRRASLGDQLKPVSEMTEMSYRPGFVDGIDMALRLKPEERPKSVADWRHMLMSEQGLARKPAAAKSSDERNRADDAGNSGQVSSSSDRKRPDDTIGSGSSRNGGTGTVRPPRFGSRRASLAVASVAAIALAGMGAFALFRPEPEPGQRPKPPISKDVTSGDKKGARDDGKASPGPKTDLANETKTGPIVPVAADAEREADRAWALLTGTKDIAAIERFLELHGTSRRAVDARAQLVKLRDDARRADDERRAAEEKAAAEARGKAAEAAAAAEWSNISTSTDVALIERFLERFDKTAVAAQARKRLADIREQAEQAASNWRAILDRCTKGRDRQECSKLTAAPDLQQRVTAWRTIAQIYRDQGNYPSAIQSYDSAILLSPKDARLYNDRGIAKFLKGDRAEAIADYTEAVRIEPSHAEALNNRAWARLQLGQTANALVDANQSIAIDRSKAYAFDTRGHIFEALNLRNDAIKDYEKALELEANLETSRAGLARLRNAKK